MRKKSLPNFSVKERGIALNNAVVACLRPQGAIISDARLRKLRAYAQALIKPLIEHVTGGVDDEGAFPPCLSYEELTAILTSAALFVHLNHVLGSDKVPQKYVSDILYGEEEEE